MSRALAFAAIASAADTYPATVHALYVGACVRPATRERILDAVRALGFAKAWGLSCGKMPHQPTRKAYVARYSLAPSLALPPPSRAKARGISHPATDHLSVPASEVRS